MTSLKLFFFLSFINLKICTSTDSTTATTVIKDPESIVSRNGTFKLTFFSPPNSTNRYVGICYNKLPVKKAVWVANRNNPLRDSSGSFQISQDGNLHVLNSQNHILWSSNVTSHMTTNESKAQLLDTGNLMLFGSNNRVIWQSFDHPTDTFLPQMTLVYNKETATNSVLQSWKTPSDPSQGRFVLGLGLSVPPELFIWDNGRRHFRTGPWNGNTFLGIEITTPVFQIKGISIQTDGQGNTSLNFFNPPFPFANYELSYQGTSVQQIWDDAHDDWHVVGKYPNNECDIYGKCGDYGSCNSLSSRLCNCLRGFEPKNRKEWNQGIWSSGCTRNRQLLCGIEGSKEDVFFSLPMMKPPADANFTPGLDQNTCRSRCMENCSCLAYAFDLSVGCMTWNGTLIDIQAFSSNGVDLHLRLEHSEIGNSKNLKVVVAATLVLGIAILVAVLYFYCRRKTKQEPKSEMPAEIQERNQSLENFEELPLFKFREMAIATNNFEESNKLGEGGFGPVYKGMLEAGLEVAVKRLSGNSRQGKEEFMNEVLVISKLQHRNLVKLLGCCVEHQERLLIYEYQPNKSLDTFLFDLQKKEILDWKTRFSIIEGICRGLLYLHRDSRLKIIHRDLKPGNILLDENLNPKISDFGMARIFGGDQNQADTTRVVGTYGYMPPEYAIEGRFSEKSDVFSFGVLLLEIITGKRTRWFDEESSNLLGYVWKHWSEDNVLPLIDPIIANQNYEAEISKCIHVGLLCVQEYAEVRPDMSSVISMLGAEYTAHFRQPRPPGYTRLLRDSADSTTQSQSNSKNGLSITHFSGR